MPASTKYPHVFRPITIGSMTLKNRIQYAPVVSNHAETLSGAVTNDLLAFIGAQARSGAALVTIGSSPIDFDRARDFYGCLSTVHDTDVGGLSLLAEEAHRYGAKLSVELTHAGAISNFTYANGPAFAPSVIPGIHDPATTKEISRDEMDEVAQHWVDCIRRLKTAGFDMAMIHGGHMNLFASFLTPLLNRRTDEYGGSPENRMRFPLEILRACREEAGREFNLEMRISGDERVQGGVSIEERVQFLNAATPYIDLVNISTGGFLNPHALAYTHPSYYLPRLLNVETAGKIKQGITIPLSVAGGITSIDEAEEILASGKADMVAMAKALIADQELVTKARLGRADEIRPCLRCLDCMRFPDKGAPFRCAVNPQAGRELRYRDIPPARKKKRVLVVGGGPAGMTAARTLCERGHEVTLWERSDRLGGRLFECASLPLKDTFRAYVDWAARSTNSCGARILLGKEATPEAITDEAPDAVVVAVGAELIVPPMQGSDLPHVVTVVEADLGRKPVGANAVVCGGGLSGSECALGLAMQGKKVKVIDVLSEEALCQDISIFARIALVELMQDHGVERVQGSVHSVTADGVVVTLPDGTMAKLAADTVVIAFGLRPAASKIKPLMDLIPESYAVGDCNDGRRIFDANHQAFNVAVEV
ncbi:MAG: FAD-dependent oxidoreductase [Thermoleophilia bacterium]|nr:FAD-dependent oxidoreductase [Thermoleophilia bacterium]